MHYLDQPIHSNSARIICTQCNLERLKSCLQMRQSLPEISSTDASKAHLKIKKYHT